jgi:hypothetical protein
MKEKILKSIELKDEKSFIEGMMNWVNEITNGLDDYTITYLTNELKYVREGKRGRVTSPFTEQKSHSNTGKRGRPVLSTEEKLERIKIRFDKEVEDLKKNTKYKEFSKEEIEGLNNSNVG